MSGSTTVFMIDSSLSIILSYIPGGGQEMVRLTSSVSVCLSVCLSVCEGDM